MRRIKFRNAILAVSLVFAFLSISNVSTAAFSSPQESGPVVCEEVLLHTGMERATEGQAFANFDRSEIENIKQPDFSEISSVTIESITDEKSAIELVKIDTEEETLISTAELVSEEASEEPASFKSKGKNLEKNVFASQIDASITYSTQKLTLNNIPKQLLNNAGIDLNSENVPIALDTSDALELNSFTTVNSDGTNTLYIFSNPVKYVDNNTGEIKFIDNTIIPLESAENCLGTPELIGFTNTENLIDVKMPNRLKEGISLEVADVSIKLYPEEQTENLALHSNTNAKLVTMDDKGTNETVVEYPNALGKGIHLQYVPINTGFKENIVLDNYTGINIFNFVIEVGEYIPLYTKGEAIPFIDPKTEEIVFIIGQIDARDSYVGEFTDRHFTLNNNIAVEEIKSGVYTLTVTVDADFLADPDTVYPVVIDPSVMITSGSMQDTSVYSGYPDRQTYYSSAYNIVGHYSSTAGYGTALIQTTNLNNYNINAGDIISATYSVYEGSGTTNNVYVQLRSILESWSQTDATYRELEMGYYVSGQVINSSGWKYFDATTLIKRMKAPVSGGESIPEGSGFALYAYNEEASAKHFCSANHSTYAPSLTIQYRTSATEFDVNTIYSPTGDTNFRAIGYLINGYSPEFKISITNIGTYVFATLNSETYFGSNNSVNTRIELFNSNHISLVYVLGNELTYNITSAGTYYVRIYNSAGTRANVKCYFIAEKTGELHNAYSHYANTTSDFYKVANADRNYNCLAYVQRKREVVGLETSTVLAKKQFTDDGAQELPLATESCIIMYLRYGDDHVMHVSIIEGGMLKSKLGRYERVRHTNIDAYFKDYYGSASSSFGLPYYFFEDVYPLN